MEIAHVERHEPVGDLVTHTGARVDAREGSPVGNASASGIHAAYDFNSGPYVFQDRGMSGREYFQEVRLRRPVLSIGL